MAKQKREVEVLVKWNADDWGDALGKARNLTQGVAEAGAQFVVAVLKRCAKFVELETHAKKNQQKDQLPDLYDAFGAPDAFTKSLWRGIGDVKANAALLAKRNSIPASQESIKELARAERLKPGAIDALIAKGLTPTSSNADVRRMLGEPQAKKARKELEVRLLASADGLAAAVKAILTLPRFAEVRVAMREEDVAVYERVKETVPAKTLVACGERLVVGTQIPHNPLAEWHRKEGKAFEAATKKFESLTADEKKKNKGLARRIAGLTARQRTAVNDLEVQTKRAGILNI